MVLTMERQGNVSRTLQKHRDSTSRLSGSLCESCSLVVTKGVSCCFCYWLHTWEIVCMCKRESVPINVFILKRGNSKQILLLLKTLEADFLAYLNCVFVGIPQCVVFWACLSGNLSYLLFSSFFLLAALSRFLCIYLPLFNSVTHFKDYNRFTIRQ